MAGTSSLRCNHAHRAPLRRFRPCAGRGAVLATSMFETCGLRPASRRGRDAGTNHRAPSRGRRHWLCSGPESRSVDGGLIHVSRPLEREGRRLVAVPCGHRPSASVRACPFPETHGPGIRPRENCGTRMVKRVAGARASRMMEHLRLHKWCVSGDIRRVSQDPVFCNTHDTRATHASAPGRPSPGSGGVCVHSFSSVHGVGTGRFTTRTERRRGRPTDEAVLVEDS